MVAVNCLISAGELQELRDDATLRIVDCRFDLLDPGAGRAAYLAAHIPGAVYADLDRDLAGPVGPRTGRHPLPTPRAAEATFSRLGIDADSRVVAYDDGNGALAARAWWLLRWLGHESAAVLDGGFRSWQQGENAVESGEVRVEPRRFRGRSRDDLVIDTQEIETLGADDRAVRLVDARDAARFRGDAEPIDTVAGHIPGARNLPFARCVDEDGRWLDAGTLKQRLAGVLGTDRQSPWSVMCGSGVTACHLVITALLSGYAEPRVYVGSWSEWIRDADRRIATGPS